MSLRLDPKYHGVRVARVRPKTSALKLHSNDNYGDIQCGFIRLKFRRAHYGAYVHRIVPAYNVGAGKWLYSLNDALEALGLR